MEITRKLAPIIIEKNEKLVPNVDHVALYISNIVLAINLALNVQNVNDIQDMKNGAVIMTLQMLSYVLNVADKMGFIRKNARKGKANVLYVRMAYMRGDISHGACILKAIDSFSQKTFCLYA